MKKIMLIGSGGAGKSTLATKLGEKLDIEVFHLDKLLWKPNWTGATKEEQKMIQNELINKETWIIDGNYGGTMDIRLKACDTIIFLDLSRIICIFRIIKRYVKYRKRTRPDMGKGCKEKLDLNFLKWVWNYPKNKKPQILKKLQQLSDKKQVITLKSRRDVKTFLANMKE